MTPVSTPTPMDIRADGAEDSGQDTIESLKAWLKQTEFVSDIDEIRGRKGTTR